MIGLRFIGSNATEIPIKVEFHDTTLTPSHMPHNAHQQPELFPARNGLFLVAVRVDGRRSHVEPFAEFDAMMEAGKQWLWNDAVAWVILGYREKRQPFYSHRMVRRGDEIIVKEWNGREDRVRRATKQSSRGMAAPV